MRLLCAHLNQILTMILLQNDVFLEDTGIIYIRGSKEIKNN